MKKLASIVGTFLAPVLVTALAGCTHIETMQVGPPEQSHPDNCPLDISQADAAHGFPGYAHIGDVRILHEEGKGPLDPSILALVKPEACRLGGEKVTVHVSSDDNGRNSGKVMTYRVWHATTAAPSDSAQH